LPDTDAMTFALLPSPLLASGSGPVDLTGLPELPASCGILTSRAAVTSLGPARQKPAFAVLEQAPAAAGVPTARAGRLTGQQSAGKLGATQGRCFLPNGQAAGRLHFPPPLCADDLGACHPRSQRLTHVSLLAVSQTCQGQTQRGPSPRSTDHGMAQVGPRKWLSPWPLLTPERMKVLQAVQGAVRSRGYVPILFDFEKAASRDFTETVLTLAGMCAFVIADI